jgi:hypothetical protein
LRGWAAERPYPVVEDEMLRPLAGGF